jgi:pseudaminic acid cytidylyltransferase
MTSIAIIPARGGSKRIPRKNIRPFVGRPVIAYAIRTALESRLFREVMVSTEDDEIAAFASEYGAVVPFRRSQQNASDYAGTTGVLLEVLTEYETHGLGFEYGCCIYPTAPFVTADLLWQCWELMIERGFDSVFPVLRYSYPIQRSLKIEQDRATMLWPEHYGSRSQDLEPSYHDAGQFYWFNVRALREKQRLYTDNSGAVVISELQAHDIDTLEDWSVAEFKFRYLSEMDKR